MSAMAHAVPATARHPADFLIGIPWLPNGYTRAGLCCWGVPWLYHKELSGLVLPTFEHSPDDVGEIAAEIQQAIASGAWAEPTSPQDGDVVTMAHRFAPHHLGVYAAGRVIHVSAWLKAVVSQTPAQLSSAGFGRVRYLRRAAP